MDMAEIETEMADLDARYRSVANKPVDVTALDRMAELGAAVDAELTALGVQERAERVLRAIVDRYAADETARAEIRRMFDRYPSFRWAAHLPTDCRTAEGFRDDLVHLSARDQGADTRDEIMSLRAVCDRARRAGIDVDPVLAEVAAMSSDEDRYGMGSMRDILLRHRTR
ncbi:hypothetical protein ACIBO1_28325 [Micromonospora sp. NPDC049903]|uniref:hypothetical protein n=1 Tax=Micromonospora sp. NPDC049903 TaxID=3364276 RepID=UPI00379FE906